MSTTITGNDNMPLLLGAVLIIILIAFFSSRSEAETSAKGGKKKAVATTSAAPTASTTSKKSKKKKSGSKSKASSAPAAASAAPAPAAEKKKKKVVIQEPTPAAPAPAEQPESETKASKKKKKKSKKKGGGGGSNGAATAATSTQKEQPKAVVARNDDDDESDDDDELWRIQSATNRKGANDAAKRVAANKERDRARALKRQEEKAKAEAKLAAEAKAVAEAEELARKELEAKDAAAAQALAAMERQTSATAAQAQAKAAKNGATSNGDVADAAAATGEKKKRKRKKKKGASAALLDSSRDPLVKPAVSPTSVERWETVPQVEEWQEVGSKKAQQKAKMAAAALTAGDIPADLLDEPVSEEPGETSASIPAGDDPLIFIGKGGSTIQNLQDVSGAKFHLNRTTNILTISGMEDAVQIGLAEARSILAAEAERKANEATEKVTWGADAIKAVIGRGGSNIRAAQEATGVRIDADVDAGTLVIVGPSDQVAAALTLCHNAAFGEVQDVLELNSRNAVNLIYGPGFATIRSLQEETGCKLDITRGSTSLKLAGSSEAVADAAEKVRALLEANRGIEMTIDNSKVGAVYGKGGETLRSIQDRTGTQIDVARGPTHATVSVMGTAEAAARARGYLQRAIDGEVELGPGEVAEEIELGSATAAVIGRGGSKASELEKTHSVKINVRSELRRARVVGKPDNVAAAAKAITAIAKPILDAEAAQQKADEAQQSGESAWQVDADADDAEGW